MPDEDQNIGQPSENQTPPEPQTTEQPSEDSSVQTPPENTPPENTVAAALAAFNAAEQSPQTPPSQPQRIPGLNSKRKYDGLEPHELEHFSRMSTQAYEYLYPRHIKSKEYEKKIEELSKQTEELRTSSFYEQEGAWTISPEYNQLSQTHARLEGEAQFWRQQLATLEAGEKVTVLTGYDEKGRPIMSEPLDPSPQLKADILSALNRAHVLVGNYEDKLSQFTTGYKQKYQGYVGELNNVRNTLFKGADQEALAKAAQKKLDNFPQFVRGRPEVKMLAEAWVVIDGLLAMINKNNARTGTAAIRARTTQSAGPTTDAINSGSTAGRGTVAEAMKAFQAARDAGIA